MGNGGPYASFQSYLMMNKEIVRGTAPAWNSGTQISVPIMPNPTPAPTLTWQVDDSLRGSPVDVYDDILLTNYMKYDFKGYVFPDTFPALLLSVLGGPDQVTGSVAPYTHYIPLLNDPETGSQPPSYSLADVDLIEQNGFAANAKQITDAQGVSLSIDLTATGAMNYTAAYVGQSFTEIAKPTSAFTTEALVPAFNTVVNIGGGSQDFLVTKATLMIDRKAAPIFTLGSVNATYGGANPYRLWAGAITVTGTLEILVLADDLTMLNGLTYSKQVLTLTSTNANGHTIYFHLGQMQFKDPKIVRDQPYVRVTTNFAGEANTADAVTGYSPMFARATNAVSTAY